MATPVATPAVEETKATSSGTTPAPAGTENESKVTPLDPAQPDGPVGSMTKVAVGDGGAGDPTKESVSGTGQAATIIGQSETGDPPTATRIEVLGDAQFEEFVAEVCHEANRAYCSMNGDQSQARWKDAPEWQRSSAILGVRAAQAGNTPRQSHEGWMAQKLADGWIFGAEKNSEAKTHPCLVEYDKLTEEQRAKDIIFVSIVRALTTMRDSA